MRGKERGKGTRTQSIFIGNCPRVDQSEKSKRGSRKKAKCKLRKWKQKPKGKEREEAETEAEAEMCFSTLPASLWALRSLGLIPVSSSISASLAIFDHLLGQ